MTDSDLEASLLQAEQSSAMAPHSDSDDNSLSPRNLSADGCRSPKRGGSSFSGALSNIAITTIGAGMLALPRAYSTIGVALGLSITLAVCFLTYFSCSVIVKYCARAKMQSYGALVQSEFGPKGAAVLQGSIIIHVFGVMIVYLIIIDDMLIGSAPEYHGLLPYFWRHMGEPAWFLSRSVISLLLLAFVVAPMLVSRDLSIVSRFSRFSVVLLLMLAATLVSLAGLAVAQGKAADIRMWPDMATVGGSGGVGGLSSALLTVLAVSALAATCQFNLVPVHNSLQDNRTSTMLRATRGAIALAASLYATMAIAGYTLFGSVTDGDVLKNLTISFAAQIVGARAAEALLTFVVLANTINLLCNFVLKVWAIREAACELALGIPPNQLSGCAFYSFTALLVASAYGVSVVVPSVYFLVALVGSTACVTFSYVFPGLLLLRRTQTTKGKFLGAGAVGLACIMAVTAIYNTLTGHAA